MGDVDLSDQFWLVNKVKILLRNYKCWNMWFWWGVQVLFVSSYVVYKKVLGQASIKPVSHYEVQKANAMRLIGKDNFGSKICFSNILHLQMTASHHPHSQRKAQISLEPSIK